MTSSTYLVQDYINNSNAYIFLEQSLHEAYELMDKLKIDSLPVLNKDMTVNGVIKLNCINEILSQSGNKVSKLKDYKVGFLVENNKLHANICIYPHMSLKEVYSTMTYLQLKKMAVVDSVWDKKFLGIIKYEDIKNLAINALSN